MLLNDIVKQAREKPTIDWDAYCKWKIIHTGSLGEVDDAAPLAWKCSCGAVNTTVEGEKYGTCQHCGLVFLAFSK